MLLNDLADVLRRGGCGVWEEPNWKRRNHGQMARVQGVVCHHTAGGGSSDWITVMNGRPGLAGPLAQMTLERDGGVRVLSNGVAWHAGSGSHPALPGASNYTLIGIEGVSPGTGSNPWTPAQIAAYPKVCAALCWGYRLPASSAVGHFEWATPRGRKIDPRAPGGGRSWDMGAFRAEVQRHLNAFNQPKPPPEEDELNETEKKQLAEIHAMLKEFTGRELSAKDHHGNDRDNARGEITSAHKFAKEGRDIGNQLKDGNTAVLGALGRIEEKLDQP